MKFIQEPLPTARDADGFPPPGAPNWDLISDVVEADAREIRRLEVEIVTTADPKNEKRGAPSYSATDIVEAAEKAVKLRGPAPHGVFHISTIPRASTEPAIDTTLPAPDPIPADNEGWPEGTWTPGDAGGDSARPMFTKDELRALLHTPKHEYAVPEDRVKCPTCKHCWQGYAVAPVLSQTQVLFANFRRCLAHKRFIVDLSGTRIVECSKYKSGGTPPTKPAEMLERERALGIES